MKDASDADLRSYLTRGLAHLLPFVGVLPTIEEDGEPDTDELEATAPGFLNDANLQEYVELANDASFDQEVPL